MSIAETIRAFRPDQRGERPLVVAEAGVNHEGSMDTARRLIELAAAGGADAIKFQTYRAETLASRDSPAYWDITKEPTASQFELFKKHDSFWKSEFEQLRAACDTIGIEFLSTPFDLESARFLNDLMSVFKVSSSDLTNLPFIEAMAGYGKPMMLSTGAAHLWEVSEAIEVVRGHSLPVCLMHCTLSYPTPDESANLAMIGDLQRHFPEAVPGYSDHTLPNPEMDVLITAAFMGAVILEKHFTHDKTLPGNDHYHAMDVDDLRAFRRRWERTRLLMGEADKRPVPAEMPARLNARRSLVAAIPIRSGEVIETRHLTWKRPASGVSPREYRNVVGRVAATDIEADSILQWWMLR